MTTREDSFRKFYECCTTILYDPKVDPYAAAYAEAGLEMTNEHDARVQCLYIRNNLSHWRHEQAKQIRFDLAKLSEREPWLP
jgi:hypothetical protein